MNTLNKIASQIIRRISGGDQSVDSQLDRRDVIVRIRQALNELLKGEILERRSVGNRMPQPMYIGTFSGLAIAKGSNGLESDIPEFFVSLPYNAGIHRVTLTGKPMEAIIRRNNPSVSSSLECSGTEGRPSYWTEGFKIYFDEHTQVSTKKTIDLRLVVAAPDSIEIDDPLPILPEHVAPLIDIVTQRLAPQMPDDRLSNNRDELIATPK